ncbi:MAG: hypothetical protein KDK90_26520 [Leptospiraceae bacterium]|nr:hypothetical protein [Leptospiraceae bacterium]
MSAKITVKQAIIETLKKEDRPLTVEEIYSGIIKNNLYTFNSESPISIVRSELRKNCEGVELKLSKQEKYFKITSEGKYSLKN